MPRLEVLDCPEANAEDELAERFLGIFPVGAVTRAQSRPLSNVVDLSDSFLVPVGDVNEVTGSTPVPPPQPDKNSAVECAGLSLDPLPLPITRDKLVTMQKIDSTLEQYYVNAITPCGDVDGKVGYFLDNALLMRKWTSSLDSERDWSVIYQIVVPVAYRQDILSLAHSHVWSGHLGITKTYDRILRHFFWPGLKRDVAAFCRTCHTCRVTGKPNQVIPPAPLCPIPALGEPFEHVLVDCVGPLPKSRTGNQFLLTIMCVATRYPEAIPLRKITAQAVVKALIKFLDVWAPESCAN